MLEPAVSSKVSFPTFAEIMIACREIENTQRKQGERIIVPVWTKEKWEKLRKAQNLEDLSNLVAELKISNEED